MRKTTRSKADIVFEWSSAVFMFLNPPGSWLYTALLCCFFFLSSCAGRSIVMGKRLNLKEGNIIKEWNAVTQPTTNNIGDQF